MSLMDKETDKKENGKDNEKGIRFVGGNKDVILIIMASLAFILGLVLRRAFMPYISRDYSVFWEAWMNELDVNGFKALAGDFYDYAPSYLYLMWITVKTGMNRMTALKIISIAFDVVCAAVSGLIIYEIKESKTLAVMAGAIVWLSPVVISNSSMWGQCDSIYTSFLLLTLLFILKDRSTPAMIFFGIAFAFKMQTFLYLPVIILLWLFKKTKTWEFVLIPAIYFISIIPAWIAGRPFTKLLSIYFGQAEEYSERLSLKYPNIYYIIGEFNLTDWYSKTGIIFAVCVLLLFMTAVILKLLNEKLTPSLLLMIVYCEGALALYFLPQMHERYGYFIEIIAILIAVLNIRFFWVPVTQILVTFITYGYYYNYDKEKLIPFPVLSLAMLFIMMFMIYKTFSLQETKQA